MDAKKLMIIFGLAIICLLVLFLVIDRIARNKKEKVGVNNSKLSLRGIFWLYRFFSQTPLLKRFYLKIKTNLEIKYPADEMSVRRKATLTMAKALGISILIMIGVIFLADGDYFFMLMGLFLVYFLFTYLLSRTEEKLDTKLLNQLGEFITDLRHHYSSEGNVEDAIYETLDETPYEMGLHATKIYRILNSTRTEEEVDKYTDTAPNNFMLTLVAICATIKEYGDKRLEDGQSLFLTNINYLKEEINVELIRRKKTAFLFSGLIALTLLPLLFLKAIEAWGTSNIPEMASFYQGTAGTVIMGVIFVVTLLTYQLVSNLKDGHINDTRDHKFITKLLEIPFINKTITKIINLNYTKHLRIDDGLKMVNDRIGIKGFLVKRILYGILAVALINVVIFTSEYRSRINILNDFSDCFESSIVPNEEYRETMRSAAKDYTNMYKEIEDNDTNRLMVLESVKDTAKLRENFAEEVRDEVFLRIAQFNDVYYRWYFIIINVLGFLLGYYIPYLILIYQLKVVQMDMEDEVIQYQTIVLILMHVDGIMIDTVLEWMERFAYCFKQSISECIINLEYSTQKALQKMKNQETFAPFRRFVDNLLMVDDEDILTAFSEIETDREYYKEKRKTDNEIIATKKSEIGKLIAFVPLIVTLVADLIVPFAIYAMKMMSTIGI